MCGLPAASLVAGAALGAAADGAGGGAAAGSGAGLGVARLAGLRAAGAVAIDGLAPSTAARAEPCSGSPTTRAHPPKSPAATAARPPKASPMFNRSILGPPLSLRCRHFATVPALLYPGSLKPHCFARNNAPVTRAPSSVDGAVTMAQERARSCGRARDRRQARSIREAPYRSV